MKTQQKQFTFQEISKKMEILEERFIKSKKRELQTKKPYEEQIVIFNSLQLAKKILNISNSLSIICLQNGLYQTAFYYLTKSAKLDLAFFEVNKSLHNHVVKWRGRVLFNNVLAYFFYTLKDYGNALKYTFEAQSQAVELNESKNRDCDYIISVNFVTFLILWKIGKFEEARRYVDINRKLIEVLLDEEQFKNQSESQLSIILEQSHQTFNKQTFSVDSKVKQSTDGLEQIPHSIQEDINQLYDKRMIAQLLDSDSEDENPQGSSTVIINGTGDQQQQSFSYQLDGGNPEQKNSYSRLSKLSKLNLLGLIDLSIIAANIKLTKDIDLALKNCEESIDYLKVSNLENSQAGIASQNLIEELYETLMKIKEKDLDVDEIAASLSGQQQIRHQNVKVSTENQQLDYLKNVRIGNKIIQSKEFKLVFYITCFVPFIRPNLPIIKQSEIFKLKSIQKEKVRKKKVQSADHTNFADMIDLYNIDTSQLEYFKRQKESILEDERFHTGKLSILVKLYEEDFAKKQKHDLAFQNTLITKLEQRLQDQRKPPMALKSQLNGRRVSNNVYQSKANYRAKHEPSTPSKTSQNFDQIQEQLNEGQQDQYSQQQTQEFQPHFTDEVVTQEDISIAAQSNQKSKSVENYPNPEAYSKKTNAYQSQLPLIQQQMTVQTAQGNRLKLNHPQRSLTNRHTIGKNLQQQETTFYENSYYSNMFPSFVPKQKYFQRPALLNRITNEHKNVYQNQVAEANTFNKTTFNEKLNSSSVFSSHDQASKQSQSPLSKSIATQQKVPEIENLKNSTDFSNFSRKNIQTREATLPEQIVPKTTTAKKLTPQFPQNYFQYRVQTQKKFDIYKYQRTGMMKLNVDQMAKQLGINHEVPQNDIVKQMNIEQIEAKLEKSNKRFKVINSQAQQYINQKQNNHSFIKAQPNRIGTGFNNSQYAPGGKSMGETSQDISAISQL